MTIAPATANEPTSTLNNLNNHSPKNKKATKIMNAMAVALKGFMPLPSPTKLRKIGTEPKTSIKANSTMKTLAIFVKSKFITF